MINDFFTAGILHDLINEFASDLGIAFTEGLCDMYKDIAVWHNDLVSFRVSKDYFKSLIVYFKDEEILSFNRDHLLYAALNYHKFLNVASISIDDLLEQD